MPGIALQNGLIYFYGNPAGYTEGRGAVVDRIFQCDELNQWLGSHRLAPRWMDGVLEQLLTSGKPDSDENAAPLKGVRIWQLRPEVDVRMKFISLADMQRQFGAPAPEYYRIAYDGQPDTNDLELIYERFSARPPPGFSGYALSMSDVIELYDGGDSAFYYIDRAGFRQIDFKLQ